MSLTRQAAERMLTLEGRTLPTEESDYDLRDLYRKYGDDTPDAP